MRTVLVMFLSLLAAGCVHLDAEPMDFTCGSLLDGHVTTYRPSPLFAQIQRDAGYDDLPEPALSGPPGLQTDAVSDGDPLVVALRPGASLVADRAGPPKVLMLSGGGSWGAFGAGFLRQRGIRDWTIVTGISTGSLQGLFVAAGDYERMTEEYAISKESDLATERSKLGILRKGSQYDMAPLRAQLFDYLLSSSAGELPFARMARADAPSLFIGMVEASTGELKIVAVTAIVREAYARGNPSSTRLAALADCIGGVTLASSSIPVRLSPVRIDGKAYLDGGVRSSVFEAGVARRLEFAARSAQSPAAPELYVIRNGPTIVFRDKLDATAGQPEVDVRPDVGRIGMRGYSTIVNQSELMSIAALRLGFPQGPIRVMTADGFNHPRDPQRCGQRPEAVFDPIFMRCLIAWGQRKADRCPWIELEAIGSRNPDNLIRREEPCDAFDKL